MSCDYYVYCRACDERHDFNDANHRDRLMAHLIQHAAAIATLAPALDGYEGSNLTLGTSYGRVDCAWFARHLGHDLVAVDEYGRVSDRCNRRVTCGECRSERWCGESPGHAGPCKPGKHR